MTDPTSDLATLREARERLASLMWRPDPLSVDTAAFLETRFDPALDRLEAALREKDAEIARLREERDAARSDQRETEKAYFVQRERAETAEASNVRLNRQWVACGLKLEAAERELARLREGLRRILDWEKYDADYADDATIREHDQEYAEARALLAGSPSVTDGSASQRPDDTPSRDGAA